ncbi:peptidylprolyl isomerase [Bacillaceae bacterium]
MLAALCLVLASGCGKGEQTAQEGKNAQPAQTEAERREEAQPAAVEFAEKESEVIARYKGGEVKAGEFATFLNVQSFISPQYAAAIQNPQEWENMLKGYIAEQLLAARADNREEAEKKAQEMAQQLRDQYKRFLGNDENKVDEWMEKQKISQDDIVRYLTRYNQVEAYLRSQVNDEDLRKIYEENKEKGVYTRATVRHILIGTEIGEKKRSKEEAKKLAAELADRLRKGEDFAKLAKEYSDDPGSKDNGGLYPDWNVNEWVPEFREAALTQKIGEIGDPIEVDYGYHVLKVEKRYDLPLEEVKEEVTALALQREYERFVKDELDDEIEELNVPAPKRGEREG